MASWRKRATDIGPGRHVTSYALPVFRRPGFGLRARTYVLPPAFSQSSRGGNTRTMEPNLDQINEPQFPEGQVKLTFHGYLSTDPAALATTETWTETYTSQDLFESGAAYALVHTSLSG